jgi:hypothetical protein
MKKLISLIERARNENKLALELDYISGRFADTVRSSSTTYTSGQYNLKSGQYALDFENGGRADITADTKLDNGSWVFIYGGDWLTRNKDNLVTITLFGNDEIYRIILRSSLGRIRVRNKAGLSAESSNNTINAYVEFIALQIRNNLPTRLFINGVYSQDLTALAISGGSTTWRIGQTPSGLEQFTGNIKYLAVLDNTMTVTDNEVLAMYNELKSYKSIIKTNHYNYKLTTTNVTGKAPTAEIIATESLTLPAVTDTTNTSTLDWYAPVTNHKIAVRSQRQGIRYQPGTTQNNAIKNAGQLTLEFIMCVSSQGGQSSGRIFSNALGQTGDTILWFSSGPNTFRITAVGLQRIDWVAPVHYGDIYHIVINIDKTQTGGDDVIVNGVQVTPNVYTPDSNTAPFGPDAWSIGGGTGGAAERHSDTDFYAFRIYVNQPFTVADAQANFNEFKKSIIYLDDFKGLKDTLVNNTNGEIENTNLKIVSGTFRVRNKQIECVSAGVLFLPFSFGGHIGTFAGLPAGVTATSVNGGFNLSFTTNAILNKLEIRI